MSQVERSPQADPLARCGIDPAQLASFRAALRTFFGRRIANREEVEDLVQETLARLFAGARDLELREPQAYLFRIAANLLADRHRRGRSSAVDFCVLEDSEIPAVGPEQEDGRRYRDLQYVLEAALGELSPRCRNIFIMRRFREMDTEMIADAVGISQRMVQKYLVQATAHLYARLGPLMQDDR
jgi:RNA polymerase sigma-70 factor (ECF subfamily)